MNSLNRNIASGDRLMMKNGRIFVCNGSGFGCYDFTMGSAIMGHYLDDPERLVKTSGNDIDLNKTVNSFSQINGWINRFTGIADE